MAVVQVDELTAPPQPNPEVGRAGAADQLFYYNVDSCLTFTFLFYQSSVWDRAFSCITGATNEIGCAIGGHAAQFHPVNDYQPNANALRVLAAMFAAAGQEARRIRSVVAIGTLDVQDWGTVGLQNRINGRFWWYGLRFRYISTAAGAVDICFDLVNQQLSVANHAFGRTAAQTIANAHYQVAFNNIPAQHNY